MPINWPRAATKPAADHGEQTNSNGEEPKMSTFQLKQPRWGLDSVILPDHTRQEIKAALTKVRFHHVLYEDWGLGKVDANCGRTSVNLYGPPGTGKTRCAEAIAHELDVPLICVNYAEIESKYVGETPKNISAVFALAKEKGAALGTDQIRGVSADSRYSRVQGYTAHSGGLRIRYC